MGSLLRHALTNILVRYRKEKLFSEICKPADYSRFVDDTFALFQNEKESAEYLIKLNRLHPTLKFTFKNQKNKCFPFSMSTSSRPKQVKIPVPTTNKHSSASNYAGNLLHRSNARLVNFDTRTSRSPDKLQEQINRRNSPN